MVKFWIIVVLVVLAAYVLRYVLNKVLSKGADAVSNAYKRKKNEEAADRSENLSDQYKK